MIKLENLCKTYVNNKKSHLALNNINLFLPSKGIAFIVGKSGCGKTTLLNIIGGLDNYDSGKFIYQNFDTSLFSEKDWDKYRNSYVGFVFQENNLLEEYNVFENINIATDLQSESDEKNIIEESLEFVGLSGYSKRKISELSGGQKQRVAIARAISKKSSILLADEPTGSLDNETGQEIFKLLKRISLEKLVVIVTHDLESAKEYGDYIYEIKDGQIDSIKNNEELDLTPNNNLVKRKFLKPKLCLKLATKAFIKMPIRLLVLIVLSMFGFSLMVGALKFSTWNPSSLQEKVLEREGKILISLTPETIELGNGMFRDEPKCFSKDRFEKFSSDYNEFNVVGVSEFDEEYGNQGFFRQLDSKESIYYDSNIYGITAMDSNDFKSHDLKLLAGEYPNDTWSDYDIAISKYMFEIYNMLGFTYDGLKEMKINSYDDLLGKKFGGMYGDKYTIRGIIDTKFDRTNFQELKDYSCNKNESLPIDLMNEFGDYRKKGFHNTIFISPTSDIAIDEYEYIIMNYESKLIRKSNLIDMVLNGEEYVFSDYYSQVLKYQSSQTGKFGGIMLSISIVSICFAIILFANFITVSINDKMKQIGILRAMGASKGDISIVFILQNLIIAIIVSVFSCIFIKYCVMPVLIKMGTTTEFPFPWYDINLIDYIMLLGIIILTSILSSIIPLTKLSIKTPRQLISN